MRYNNTIERNKGSKMKVKTAVQRVTNAVVEGEFQEAQRLLTKYRRRFGNRHFGYWLRLAIANGLHYGC
jgi:pyrroloquinoline quinone (PQQ) biosynthesis protein C